MVSSRFNANSKEENGPFPGWFIQIVGNRLSIGIGNGKTWLSLTSKQQINNNTLNLVQFSLDNENKNVMLGLNKQYVVKKDITFRVPVSYLTLGALNMKNEFRFVGELYNINIGTSWKKQLVAINITRMKTI